MSEQKREKPTATTALEKTNPQKPSIQAEGKLTQAQLEAIALRALAFANRRRRA